VTDELAAQLLTGEGPVLTDGAIETCLMFDTGLELVRALGALLAADVRPR
jgi:hypothetical protein